jgi:hypothetical protein
MRGQALAASGDTETAIKYVTLSLSLSHVVVLVIDNCESIMLCVGDALSDSIAKASNPTLTIRHSRLNTRYLVAITANLL